MYLSASILWVQNNLSCVWPLRLHVGYLGCCQYVEETIPLESVLFLPSSLLSPWLKLAPSLTWIRGIMSPQAPSYTLLAGFYISDRVTLLLQTVFGSLLPIQYNLNTLALSHLGWA